MCAENPIEEAAQATDALCLFPVGLQVGGFSDFLLDVALASRSIFAAIRDLSEEFPWRFGLAHYTKTLDGHYDCVTRAVHVTRGACVGWGGEGEQSVVGWTVCRPDVGKSVPGCLEIDFCNYFLSSFRYLQD